MILSHKLSYNIKMTPHPSTYEYFLGITLPEPENTFFTQLKSSFQPGRPLSSPPHLTLLPPFEFPNFQRLDGLLARWASYQRPFTSKLEKVGTFTQKRHSTVFLQPEKGRPFKHLVSSLNDFLVDLEPVKNFQPHLTIGHKVSHEERDQRKDELRALDLKLTWHVESVTLFRKIPGENWTILKTYAFDHSEGDSEEDSETAELAEANET